MMTANLFVIANVKQLRTGGSFRILLPVFRTSWGVGVLNLTIFNSFHNWVEFGTILEGLRNFRGGGRFEHPNPPSVCHCLQTIPILSFYTLYNSLIILVSMMAQTVLWLSYVLGASESALNLCQKQGSLSTTVSKLSLGPSRLAFINL